MIPEIWWEEGALFGSPDGMIILGYSKPQFKSSERLDFQVPAFYFPDFFLESPSPWIQYSHSLQLDSDQFFSLFEHDLKSTRMSWEGLELDPFKTAFKNLQKEFQLERLVKAVPYTFLHSPQKMTKKVLINSLKNALAFARKTRGYLYGFWNISEGMLGVTPELLFECDHLNLKTMALAGTRKKSEDAAEALLNDPKELREHQWVIDGIKESLNSYGIVKTGPLGVVELPTLLHLKTEIQATLFNNPLYEDLVKALHPTPALGAFPRVEGWKWLKQYQKRCPRNRYGAPVGLRFQNKNCYAVAIRNMQWDDKGVHIGAGCGVIKESQYENEWNEIQLKMDSIKRIFGFQS